MFRFATWFQRARSTSGSQERRRRRKADRRSRRLFLEPLEERRMLAYTVTFLGGNYLTIIAAATDTAQLSVTESGNDLEVTDTGGTTFSASTLTGETGVTVTSTGVTIDEAATNVSHMYYGIPNSRGNTITFGNLPTAVQGFQVTAFGDGTGATAFLDGNITTSNEITNSDDYDPADADIGFYSLPVEVDAPSITIATAAGVSDLPGEVFFDAQVYAGATGDSLAIDTDPVVGTQNAADVTLAGVGNGTTHSYVDNLSVTAGEILTPNTNEYNPAPLTANITTDGSQTYTGEFTFGFPVQTATLTSNDGGNIDFNSGITSNGANLANLVISTAGATTFSGAVAVGSVDVSEGPTQIDTDSIYTYGAQTYVGPVSLGVDADFTSTSSSYGQDPNYDLTGGISFDSTVDGAFDLIAEAENGPIDFGGAVGGSVPLTSLSVGGYPNGGAAITISAPITTTGVQTYDGTVELQSAGSITEGVSFAAGTFEVLLQAEQGSTIGGQSLQFSVDGAPAGSITPASSAYASYGSAEFSVAAGTHTVSIVSSPADSGNSIFLQDISTMTQVADPDFSTPTVASGTWQYAPAGSPWTFTGTAGVSGNYSGITAGNPTAPQGSQVGFVQDTGSISQSVTLPAGTYTLDFLAAQRENYNHGGQSLQVLVDGSPVGSPITPAGSSYDLYGSAAFSVGTGMHTITIEGLDPNGQDNTALIDEVTIQPVAPNQLADPNFSDASESSGTWQYGPSNSAWYFLGTAGVSGNSSGITAGNPAAPQGNQVGFVQGTGSISQAVSFSAGTYAIQFEAAQRENYNFGGQTLQVSIDGIPVDATITPTGADYTLYTTPTVSLTSGTHVITISGLDPKGGDNTALIDDVTIVPVYASQIVDPDFSAATVGSGTWQYAPADLSWTYSGTAGVSGNSSGITAGNPAAPEGSQVGFVQDTGSISETVGMSAGTYTLSFLAAQRENYNHGGQSLEVLVDGSPVSGDITPASSSYSAYSSAAFTVTAGMHTIEILGLDPSGGDNTALIDSVSLAPGTLSQVADPDFAAVTVASGTWQYAPAGSPWTFSGTAGVSGNWSGITNGNSTAPEGNQVAFVQETGSISQVVGMSAGTYTLDFLSAQRENYNYGGQSLEVLVDGSPVGSSITPAGSSYALYGSSSFTVTAGIHTITIEGLDPSGGDNTALVDSVSLEPVIVGQVADPNFSASNVGPGNWQYAPADSAWYFLGTAGVSGNSSSITNLAPPQGNQAGFVEQTGSISQVVSLAAGTYTIQFDAAQAQNYHFDGESLQVSIDGVPVGATIMPAAAGYALVTTATFTVGAGTHVISIAGLNSQGGATTALIDSVAIVAST